MQNDNSFLRAVAQAYSADDAICTFIFPSRRAAKFFQRFYAIERGKRTRRPFFSPKMLTVSELFCTLSGMEQMDTLAAQYLLYECYCKVVEEIAKAQNPPLQPVVEPFDEFYGWSSIIIKDFNDIDSYLADAGRVFDNISDLKEIDNGFDFLSDEQKAALREFWGVYLTPSSPTGGNAGNVDSGSKLDKKGSFSAMWKIMGRLYKEFRSALQEGGKGYGGLIFRTVYDKLAEIKGRNGSFEELLESSYGRLVFVGFNAPNKCEVALMEAAQRAGRADFYWDFYGSMVTDPDNKSSLFIKEHCKNFKSKYDISNLCSTADAVGGTANKQHYEVIQAASGVGQCYAAKALLRELLQNKPQEQRMEDLAFSTAILLPDASLLTPLLNIIPAEFDKVNVTMGYPLQFTSLFSFLKLMAELQRDILQKNGDALFYHRSLMALLKHNYFAENAEAMCLAERLLTSNIVYYKPSEKDPLLVRLLKYCKDSSELCEWTISVARSLEDKVMEEERALLPLVISFLNRLKGLDLPIERGLWLKIFERSLSQISAPFSGEPLAGLQIMGPLEIRGLDFENIIILSANDGVFPASNLQQSFIPYNIRYAYGLPTYELADAISAYHFYRSIYRAKNIYLIYDSRAEGVVSGEVSRYCKQLKYLYGVNLVERTFDVPMTASPQRTSPVVKKSEEVMNKLKDLKISASALNTYRDCPMKFYWSYVERKREEDEIREAVEYDTFGTIFHNSMQRIYGDEEGICGGQKNITVNRENLETYKQSGAYKAIVEEELKKELRVEVVEGQNLIIQRVLERYVEITLDADMKSTQFTYISGEESMNCKYPITPAGFEIKLYGQIDRLDEIGGVVRISDYKTGRVDSIPKDFEPSMLFDTQQKRDFKALFQIYFYALLYSCVKGSKNTIKSAIYPLRSLKSGGVISLDIDKNGLADYKSRLDGMLEEIYNPNVDFNCRLWGEAHCNYCDFKNNCYR